MARPGGNVTGLASFADELAGKRVEILNEVLPKSTRIGVIADAGGRGSELQVKVMKEVASALGLKLVEIGVANDAEKLVQAFQTAVRERVDAIITTSGAAVYLWIIIFLFLVLAVEGVSLAVAAAGQRQSNWAKVRVWIGRGLGGLLLAAFAGYPLSYGLAYVVSWFL